MTKGCANLLEHEGRIALTYHTVQQDRRLGKGETAVFGIYLSYLLVDVCQEAQFLDMIQHKL